MVSSAYTPGRISLFVPNLIGYTRIAFSLISYLIAPYYPMLFLFLYTASFVLDAADGMAARALDQCSHFGSILDMLTDRASTAGMLVILDGVLQPAPHYVTFVLSTLLFLDVGSHFCRMYASVFVQKESHKDVSDSIFWLLRQYYSKRKFMGVLCIGQEFSYIVLFAWNAYRDVPTVNTVLWFTFVACAIPCVLKQVVNVQQLVDGLYHIAVVDAKERNEKKK